MLSVLNKSLVVMLAMLQFFAPLVHAHTGDKSFNQGLHIPGLESFHTLHDAAVVQNVNVDQSSEGLLVVVDSGIKNPHEMFVENTDTDFILLPSGHLPVIALPESDQNFSPQTQPVNSRKLLPAHTPRAPPAQ
jgi:hypothetical protein